MSIRVGDLQVQVQVVCGRGAQRKVEAIAGRSTEIEDRGESASGDLRCLLNVIPANVIGACLDFQPVVEKPAFGPELITPERVRVIGPRQLPVRSSVASAVWQAGWVLLICGFTPPTR